ncbi:hypothetical protein LZ30DRAFT_236595 [Colletotrichum cereale]|nr:hypothetical protein LZ30DRAFT_236595 [Colletotrichum cereale]
MMTRDDRPLRLGHFSAPSHVVCAFLFMESKRFKKTASCKLHNLTTLLSRAGFLLTSFTSLPTMGRLVGRIQPLQQCCRQEPGYSKPTLGAVAEACRTVGSRKYSYFQSHMTCWSTKAVLWMGTDPKKTKQKRCCGRTTSIRRCAQKRTSRYWRGLSSLASTALYSQRDALQAVRCQTAADSSICCHAILGHAPSSGWCTSVLSALGRAYSDFVVLSRPFPERLLCSKVMVMGHTYR